MTEKPLNIFVVGLDDFHLAQLMSLPNASDYRFHALYSSRELKQQDHFPVQELLSDGIARLKAFPEKVDAVVGYWDFPVSTVLPLLRNVVNLPGPSLESVLKCEHKYWSRVLQQEVIPEHIPQFCTLNPFSEDPLAQITLEYPFWLKPIKSVLSFLGFLIADEEALYRALNEMRDNIDRYAIPFNLILQQAKLPADIEKIDGFHCIAESIISQGRQCTVEGYSCNSEVKLYGVIDSLREGSADSSFSRYQYPSTLPIPVIDRMQNISRRIMLYLEYHNGPFNIEFFWDENSDHIRLLEINPRISKSHTPLFYLVDGCYHHQVMLDLALQRKPDFPQRQGDYAYAAKFMLRRHEDGMVTRVPTAQEIHQLESEIPSADIHIAVAQGMRLSSMKDQDSYSYEVAVIYLGGDSPQDLESKYQQLLQKLALEILPLAD